MSLDREPPFIALLSVQLGPWTAAMRQNVRVARLATAAHDPLDPTQTHPKDLGSTSLTALPRINCLQKLLPQIVGIGHDRNLPERTLSYSLPVRVEFNCKPL